MNTRERKVYILVEEAAAQLRCSVAQIERACSEGKLAFIESDPVLIDEDDLNAYVESLKRYPKRLASGSDNAQFLGPGRTLETPSARALRIWLVREARERSKPPKGRGPKTRE